jgi:hypothetical protein
VVVGDQLRCWVEDDLREKKVGRSGTKSGLIKMVWQFEQSMHNTSETMVAVNGMESYLSPL